MSAFFINSLPYSVMVISIKSNMLTYIHRLFGYYMINNKFFHNSNSINPTVKGKCSNFLVPV